MAVFQHIIHITTRAEWEAGKLDGHYVPAAFSKDGFVHCSTPDQVIEVANSHFRGQQGLVLVRIEPRRLKSEVCYEKDEGARTLYPHIYGPIDLDAVEEVLDFPPGEDGTFEMPGSSLPVREGFD